MINIDPHSYKISELLPHEPPMVLIDELIEWTEGAAITMVRICEESPFYIDKIGVPAHVGLEYMAQTCGVYAGLNFLNNNQPILMGFLLGTRNFHAEINWFKSGDNLIVSISEILRQKAMGVFDCKITLDNHEVASAQLTVYQSEDISEKS